METSDSGICIDGGSVAQLVEHEKRPEIDITQTNRERWFESTLIHFQSMRTLTLMDEADGNSS